MRGFATTLASALALSALVTAASADPRVSRDETISQAPSATEPTTVVQLFEYSQPVPVAQAPLPQPRPVRVATPTRSEPPVVRRVVVARVVEPAQRPAPQRIALDTKPKSPLFWMTVGVGF